MLIVLLNGSCKPVTVNLAVVKSMTLVLINAVFY